MTRRRRRFWSDEEKRRICAQARHPEVSVSQVARRYDVNANLIFKWLRELPVSIDEAEDVEPRFLPVEIVAEHEPRGSYTLCTFGADASRMDDHQLIDRMAFC